MAVELVVNPSIPTKNLCPHLVIPTSSNLPLSGNMGHRDKLNGGTWIGLMWTWILLMNYLKISTEELRNLEKDRRETK